MKNLLKVVLESLSSLIESHGFTVKIVEGTPVGVYSANLDSSKYVGTITYWPDTRFEFQFNSFESGEVTILETKEISQERELELYIRELVTNKLE